MSSGVMGYVIVTLVCGIAVTLQGCGSSSSSASTTTTTTTSPVVGSCGGTSPSLVEDCQNVDFGSCGNACCNVNLHVAADPETVVKQLQTTLADGGPDGNYMLQTTAGGSLFFDNLTQYVSKLPEPFSKSTTGVYIAQVHHTTSGPKHYVDTIDFNFVGDGKGGTLIHAFSTSLIAGALGDNGQNYKNIMTAVKGAGLNGAGFSVDHVDISCAAPSTAQLRQTKSSVRSSHAVQAVDAPAGDVVGSCGADSPSKVADCLNVDFGSCGNACCNLMVTVPASDPATIVKSLNTTLGAGGPDGHYTLQETAEGTLFFGNLTQATSHLPDPFKKSTTGVYIAQVHHMTSGPKHYNDTISFNLMGDGNGGTLLHAFSLSLIGGALGDNGQGYKNIMMALKGALDGDAWMSKVEHLSGSCPAPAPAYSALDKIVV